MMSDYKDGKTNVMDKTGVINLQFDLYPPHYQAKSSGYQYCHLYSLRPLSKQTFHSVRFISNN